MNLLWLLPVAAPFLTGVICWWFLFGRYGSRWNWRALVPFGTALYMDWNSRQGWSYLKNAYIYTDGLTAKERLAVAQRRLDDTEARLRGSS